MPDINISPSLPPPDMNQPAGAVGESAKTGQASPVMKKDQYTTDKTTQTFEAKDLRNIQSDNPMFPKVKNISYLDNISTGVVGGIPFLKSYATVTFKALRELAVIMSKISYQETAIIGVKALELSFGMAKQVGSLHKRIAEKEAMMHLVSAITNGLSAGFSFTMGALTARGSGKGLMKKMDGKGHTFEARYTQVMRSFESGFSSLFKMFEEAGKIGLTYEKGALEEARELAKFGQESAREMRQDKAKAADEAQKILDQALQLIQKIADQLMQGNPLKQG